jgi:hypothetical protein
VWLKLARSEKEAYTGSDSDFACWFFGEARFYRVLRRCSNAGVRAVMIGVGLGYRSTGSPNHRPFRVMLVSPGSFAGGRRRDDTEQAGYERVRAVRVSRKKKEKPPRWGLGMERSIAVPHGYYGQQRQVRRRGGHV